MVEDIYPTAGYARTTSLLSHPTLVYASSSVPNGSICKIYITVAYTVPNGSFEILHCEGFFDIWTVAEQMHPEPC